MYGGQDMHNWIVMKVKLVVPILSIALFSCKNGNHHNPKAKNPQTETVNPSNVSRMNHTLSSNTFSETYNTLRNALEANPNIGIVAEVDHTKNAASVSLELNPTKVVFFGNPKLGTPLMQRNPLAGLDLPQKIMVNENADGEVYARFNSTAYISNRHGLDGVATLPMIKNALTNLSTKASGNPIGTATDNNVSLGEGIITKTSNRSFEETHGTLVSAIEGNPNLRIIAQLDHQKNAAKAGLDLNPLRLIVFGNPNLGTPLMQNTQTTAMDLPQKMLVWEDSNGAVNVSYNAPAFLVARHGITGNETVLQTITNALDKLSNVATGN